MWMVIGVRADVSILLCLQPIVKFKSDMAYNWFVILNFNIVYNWNWY